MLILIACAIGLSSVLLVCLRVGCGCCVWGVDWLSGVACILCIIMVICTVVLAVTVGGFQLGFIVYVWYLGWVFPCPVVRCC